VEDVAVDFCASEGLEFDSDRRLRWMGVSKGTPGNV
jgi:hypothetical protein